LASGLTKLHADVVYQQRLLRLLGDIDDDELVRLQIHFLRENGQNEAANALSEQHEKPPLAVIGSPREVVERSVLFKHGVSRLAAIGLLQPRYSRSGGTHTIDSSTGLPKISGYNLSPLGRVLMTELNTDPMK
jgi:hypothetical protein